MSSRSRKIRFAVLVFCLLCVSYCYGGLLLPTGDVHLKRTKIASLGAIALDLEVAGQTIYVDVHYPPDRVLLVGDGGEGDAGIPYENCYWPDGFLREVSDPRHQWLSQPGFPLSPVTPVTMDGGIGREVRYGRRGNIVYRLDGPLGGRPLVDVAIRALFAGSDTLASCYVPRVRAEQWMQGGWTRLTQFSSGLFRFKKAPEDTFRIRAEFAPMRVTYLRDRVEIRAGTAEECEAASYVVGRPRPGYWPNGRGTDAYFETFKADTVRTGGRFAMEIGNMRNKPFSFDVHVVMDGRKMPIPAQMEILRSNLQSARVDCKPDCNVSTWPLLATPAAVRAAEGEPGGYPGGEVEPRWAVEKMLTMENAPDGSADAYSAVSAPNDSVYAQELRVFYDELARLRTEEAMRKKYHGARKPSDPSSPNKGAVPEGLLPEQVTDAPDAPGQLERRRRIAVPDSSGSRSRIDQADTIRIGGAR